MKKLFKHIKNFFKFIAKIFLILVTEAATIGESGEGTKYSSIGKDND